MWKLWYCSSLVARIDCGDGYRWQCRLCRKRTSIKDGSFLRELFSIQKVIWIIYCWTRDYQEKGFSKRAEFDESTLSPENTIAGIGDLGVERQTGKCFLIEMPDRKEETLCHHKTVWLNHITHDFIFDELTSVFIFLLLNILFFRNSRDFLWYKL